MSESLGSAVLDLDVNTRTFESALLGAGRTTDLFHRKGTMALGAVAAAAGATGAALFGIGEAFDSAYDKIRVTTGRTGKELDALKRDFRAVVQDVPTDFDSAATAVGGLTQRLDLQGRPLQRLTKQVLELTRITGGDLDANVRNVTRLFGDWSIATDKQEGTLDGLFRLSQRTGAEVGTLAETLVQFGSPLRTLGFELDFSAAMLAKFEKEGVNMTTLMSGLRLAVANVSDPTDDLKDRFRDLGITAKEPAEAVLQVMDAIKQTRSVTEGNTLAFEVFGRRAGSDMAAAVREGRFELDDLIETFRRGDETIRKAGRETMDLNEHWQRFKNTLAVAVEPTATEVFESLGDAMKDVVKIISDPKLSGDEKLDAIVDLVTDAIADAIPELIGAGKDAAGAVIRGFLDQGVWGRVALGALIFKMLGGVSALRASTAAGAGIGEKFGAGLKAGLMRAGITAVIVGVFEAINAITTDRGEEMAEDFAASFGDKLSQTIDRRSIPALNRLRTRTELLAAQYRHLAEQGWDDMDQLADAAERSSRRAGRAFDRLSEKAYELREDIHRLRVGFHDNLGSIEREVERNMERVEDSFGRHSKKGRQLLEANMEAGVRAIERAMTDGQITADQKLAAINDLIRQHLAMYGIKGSSAEKIIKATNEGPRDYQGGLAAGGFAGMLPGYSRTDDRLIGVRGGEAVLRPEDHVPTVDASLRTTHGFGLRELFRRTGAKIQGFARGGFAGVSGDTDFVPALGLALSRMAKATGQSIFVQSGRRTMAEQQALYASYLAGTGNLAAVPNANAPHVRGIAADITPGREVFGSMAANFGLGFTVPSESWHIELLNAAKGAVGAMRMKLLELPRYLAKYAMFAPHAAGLNRVSAGLERVLGERLATAGGTGDPSAGPGSFGDFTGSGRELMQQISKAKGWNFDDWWALDGAETSHGQNLVNPNSTARLRGQFLDFNWGKYGPGSDPRLDPSMDQQIRSMAMYIEERYGNPTAAWAFHQANNWYERGGEVSRALDGLRAVREGKGASWGGWFGGGGQITADRPTLVGIGDRGPETATIAPGKPVDPDVHVHLHGGLDQIVERVEVVIDGREAHTRQVRRMRR